MTALPNDAHPDLVQCSCVMPVGSPNTTTGLVFTVQFTVLTEVELGSYTFYAEPTSASNFVYAPDTNNPSNKTPILYEYVPSTVEVSELAEYAITLAANPAEGGSVSGAGSYTDGATATLNATANEGYTFINWTENGTAVSTDAIYSFTVTADRDLVANFVNIFTKDIIGYGTGSGGYYLIASPVAENIAPSSSNGFITDEYDLYYFDQTGDNDGNEWINYKDDENGGFDLVNGVGYLYASQENTTLTFIGTPIENGTKEVTLHKNNDADWGGWNLIGNPFAEIAYIQDIDGEVVSFYTMDDNGEQLKLVESFTSIEPMEGVFVNAEENEEVLTFTTTQPAKGSLVTLNLSNNHGFVDRAMVRFDASRPLPKFQLRKNSTKLYIPMDDNDYAVVRGESMGEIPVSFKAEENDNYTLSFKADNVEFGYLHLIDNLTGNDVDLLQTPSYSFEANISDYANRFKLVFAIGNNSDDNFACFSNASYVINNEGDATLQVVDINGRILKSESINGCANVNVNAASGIYMLRLINGDNVKVQKVVIQ